MKQRLESFQLFYVEIPQPDYLQDINIQVEHEACNYEDVKGLSEIQVSEIARDSLDATGDRRNKSDDNQLFSDNQDKS